MMKLKNSTDFADHFLRRMVAWCCREFQMPVRQLRRCQFTRCSGAYCGRAWYGSRRILVRIGGEHHFPTSGKYPDRKYAPEIDIRDRIEGLLQVTAHEIAHHVRWQHTRRNREARVDGMTLPLLAAFRANREALLAEWSAEPKARAAKPKVTRQERNDAKARALLATWERKAKLAKTKVAAYRRKVRYYDRVAATRAV